MAFITKHRFFPRGRVLGGRRASSIWAPGTSGENLSGFCLYLVTEMVTVATFTLLITWKGAWTVSGVTWFISGFLLCAICSMTKAFLFFIILCFRIINCVLFSANSILKNHKQLLCVVKKVTASVRSARGMSPVHSCCIASPYTTPCSSRLLRLAVQAAMPGALGSSSHRSVTPSFCGVHRPCPAPLWS